jgi:hypothetical protein
MAWYEVALDRLALADAGWHYEDGAVLAKLVASLRRHGQLRPVVVRTDEDGRMVVVRGRSLLAAAREAGFRDVWVVTLGEMSELDARVVSLSLELRQEVDFARLARQLDEVMEAGMSPAQLSSHGPFTPARLAHFRTLVRFDWSQFDEVSDGQQVMDWDADVPESAHQPSGALDDAEPDVEPAAPAVVPPVAALEAEDDCPIPRTLPAKKRVPDAQLSLLEMD